MNAPAERTPQTSSKFLPFLGKIASAVNIFGSSSSNSNLPQQPRAEPARGFGTYNWSTHSNRNQLDISSYSALNPELMRMNGVGVHQLNRQTSSPFVGMGQTGFQFGQGPSVMASKDPVILWQRVDLDSILSKTTQPKS